MKLIKEYRVPRKERKWEYNWPTALCFYWERGTYDRMLNRKLEDDDEFVKWCSQNSIQVHHDWVECPDDETVLLFALRWV